MSARADSLTLRTALSALLRRSHQHPASEGVSLPRPFEVEREVRDRLYSASRRDVMAVPRGDGPGAGTDRPSDDTP